MLSRPRHQAPTNTEQREVHGFCTRGDERDLGARRAQCLGGDVAGPIKRATGSTALGVQARRVTGWSAAEGFGDFGEDRRRPCVV